MKTLAALLVFAVTAIAASQQHNPTPVPELQKISFMQGHWVGTQTFNTDGPPMAMEAANQVEMAIGGRYIEEKLATTLPNHTRSDTRHFLTFDPESGLFKAWWFNDSSPGGPMMLEGKLDGRKLVMQSVPSPEKKMSPVFRATYESESGNRLTFALELKTGDAWRPLFKTEYRRIR